MSEESPNWLTYVNILVTDASVYSIFWEFRHTVDLDDPITSIKTIVRFTIKTGRIEATGLLCGSISVLDSCGAQPDTSVEWVNSKMSRRLCETPCLTNMIRRSAVILNNVKYRDRSGYVRTRVLHVAHRLYRLHNVGLDLRGNSYCMQYINDGLRMTFLSWQTLLAHCYDALM